jgi:hypothetical protein
VYAPDPLKRFAIRVLESVPVSTAWYTALGAALRDT